MPDTVHPATTATRNTDLRSSASVAGVPIAQLRMTPAPAAAAHTHSTRRFGVVAAHGQWRGRSREEKEITLMSPPRRLMASQAGGSWKTGDRSMQQDQRARNADADTADTRKTATASGKVGVPTPSGSVVSESTASGRPPLSEQGAEKSKRETPLSEREAEKEAERYGPNKGKYGTERARMFVTDEMGPESGAKSRSTLLSGHEDSGLMSKRENTQSPRNPPQSSPSRSVSMVKGHDEVEHKPDYTCVTHNAGGGATHFLFPPNKHVNPSDIQHYLGVYNHHATPEEYLSAVGSNKRSVKLQLGAHDVAGSVVSIASPSRGGSERGQTGSMASQAVHRTDKAKIHSSSGSGASNTKNPSDRSAGSASTVSSGSTRDRGSRTENSAGASRESMVGGIGGDMTGSGAIPMSSSAQDTSAGASRSQDSNVGRSRTEAAAQGQRGTREVGKMSMETRDNADFDNPFTSSSSGGSAGLNQGSSTGATTMKSGDVGGRMAVDFTRDKSRLSARLDDQGRMITKTGSMAADSAAMTPSMTSATEARSSTAAATPASAKMSDRDPDRDFSGLPVDPDPARVNKDQRDKSSMQGTQRSGRRSQDRSDTRGFATSSRGGDKSDRGSDQTTASASMAGSASQRGGAAAASRGREDTQGSDSLAPSALHGDRASTFQPLEDLFDESSVTGAAATVETKVVNEAPFYGPQLMKDMTRNDPRFASGTEYKMNVQNQPLYTVPSSEGHLSYTSRADGRPDAPAQAPFTASRSGQGRSEQRSTSANRGTATTASATASSRRSADVDENVARSARSQQATTASAQSAFDISITPASTAAAHTGRDTVSAQYTKASEMWSPSSASTHAPAVDRPVAATVTVARGAAPASVAEAIAAARDHSQRDKAGSSSGSRQQTASTASSSSGMSRGVNTNAATSGKKPSGDRQFSTDTRRKNQEARRSSSAQRQRSPPSDQRTDSRPQQGKSGQRAVSGSTATPAGMTMAGARCDTDTVRDEEGVRTAGDATATREQAMMRDEVDAASYLKEDSTEAQPQPASAAGIAAVASAATPPIVAATEARARMNGATTQTTRMSASTAQKSSRAGPPRPPGAVRSADSRDSEMEDDQGEGMIGSPPGSTRQMHHGSRHTGRDASMNAPTQVNIARGAAKPSHDLPMVAEASGLTGHEYALECNKYKAFLARGEAWPNDLNAFTPHAPATFGHFVGVPDVLEDKAALNANYKNGYDQHDEYGNPHRVAGEGIFIDSQGFIEVDPHQDSYRRKHASDKMGGDNAYPDPATNYKEKNRERERRYHQDKERRVEAAMHDGDMTKPITGKHYPDVNALNVADYPEPIEKKAARALREAKSPQGQSQRYFATRSSSSDKGKGTAAASQDRGQRSAKEAEEELEKVLHDGDMGRPFQGSYPDPSKIDTQARPMHPEMMVARMQQQRGADKANAATQKKTPAAEPTSSAQTTDSAYAFTESMSDDSARGRASSRDTKESREKSKK